MVAEPFGRVATAYSAGGPGQRGVGKGSFFDANHVHKGPTMSIKGEKQPDKK
jgi:hypothetical protein